MKITNVCLCFGLFVMLAWVLAPGNALAQIPKYPPCCGHDTGAEFEALTITSSGESPELMQEPVLLPYSFNDPWAEPEALPAFESMPAPDPAQEPILPRAVLMNPKWKPE
ncbi:MAG: hypothetical protein JXR49_20375 [Acidobacteria bacterium]|nr:hypothetical protein [Acidobacteriota bacterium]